LVAAAHPARDAVDERREHGIELVSRYRPAAERALRPERSPSAALLDRPKLAVVGDGVQITARRAPEQ